MPVVHAGPAGTPCEIPRAPLALVQNEAETSRTPAQNLFPFLDGANFADGSPRWKVHVFNEQTFGGALRGPAPVDALVLGYNAVHLSGDVKDALNAEPPAGHAVVLHQMNTDCLTFLRDRLAINLQPLPSGGDIGLPAERRERYEPLLNWPRPVDVADPGLTGARALRWLSFRPGTAWRVVLEARVGSRRLPVLVRTTELEPQRIVVCTLLLEARTGVHAHLLENIVTYATTGWPEVAVVDVPGGDAGYDADLLVQRLRVEGTRAIRVESSARPLPLEHWPLAGVQRVVIPADVPFAEATTGTAGEEWSAAGGTLVQVDETGVTVRAGAPDELWVARRWGAWFTGTDPQRWLVSIFATRSIATAFTAIRGRLTEAAADNVGLGGTLEPYHRRIAALLSRRVRAGSVDETIGVTAAALDLHRLCGGRALATPVLVQRWLRSHFEAASPEDRLDIARALRGPDLLARALNDATADQVSAIWVIRVRQAVAAVRAEHPDAAVPPLGAELLAEVDGDRVHHELATSPLLAAELLVAARDLRAVDAAHPLASLADTTRRAAIDGLIELQALTREDLAAAGPHAISLEATAILAWLDLFPGAGFQVRREARELPVKVVESVLREVRRAREREEDAHVDLPALGSIVHLLAPLALVAAAFVLAAVLRIFEVRIGTEAAWWAAGGVAGTAVGLTLVRFLVVPRFVRRYERRDVRFAQSVVGVLLVMVTVAMAPPIFRALDSLVGALVVLTIAVALMAAFVVVVLDRLRLSPPWMADVLSFLGDPKALLDWARRRGRGEPDASAPPR